MYRLMLLYSQRKLGYTSLTGVDYSEGAVTLAKSVAHTEGYDDITYEVCYKALIDVPKFGRFSQYLNEHTLSQKKKKKKKQEEILHIKEVWTIFC